MRGFVRNDITSVIVEVEDYGPILDQFADPIGADVRDFGIRGMDLAYAMQNEYDAVVFIDAAPRGAAPGTLFVIDAAVVTTVRCRSTRTAWIQ